MNKLWKKYDTLTSECYRQFASGNIKISCWNDAFATLLQAIEAERENNKNFGRDFFTLEDELDYRYDIQGWLEDYLDELEVKKLHDTLIKCCEKLISLFDWEEDSPSDFKFRITSALGEQKKFKEAHEFCEQWYAEEPDNLVAATATVYGRIGVKDMTGAEEIVKHFIADDTTCNDDNDIMFIAAEQLYKSNGNKTAEKKITKSMQKYEEELSKFLLGLDDDNGNNDDWDWGVEDLPF